MAEAIWDISRVSGYGSVEFQNGEYAEWKPENDTSTIRWSSALPFLEMIDLAPAEFTGRTKLATVKFENEPNGQVNVTDLVNRSNTSQAEVEFFRSDTRDFSLLWCGPDKTPPHDEPEYAELLLLTYREGARHILEQLIAPTATPQIAGISTEIITAIEKAKL